MNLTPEQADASECLYEAMRIMNSEIRRAVASGLDIDAMLLTMRSTRTKVGIPQVSFAARPRNDHPIEADILAASGDY